MLAASTLCVRCVALPRGAICWRARGDSVWDIRERFARLVSKVASQMPRRVIHPKNPSAQQYTKKKEHNDDEAALFETAGLNLPDLYTAVAKVRAGVQ
jgi:hypothetical protein